MEILKAEQVAFDPERVTVQIMTRGRPELFLGMVASMADRVADPARTNLWVYVDADDPTVPDLVNRCREAPFAIPINWVVGPRTTSMGATFNQVNRLARETSGIFFGFPDDFHMDTHGWDEVIRQCYRNSPDRFVLAYVRDQTHNDIAKIMALSREWVDTLGYFFPPYFPYWFGDLWIDQIARAVDRKVELKIQITDTGTGGKGKTQRMWNLPFWSRFFTACAEQRFREAGVLLAAMPARTPVDLESLQTQRQEWMEQFRVHLNNVGILAPHDMVAVELMLTNETTTIPAVYLQAEREALEHLRSLGLEAPTFRVPPPIPRGGVTPFLQQEVVRALLNGASFAEAQASSPEEASRAMEWRNAYVTGRRAGLDGKL